MATVYHFGQYYFHVNDNYSLWQYMLKYKAIVSAPYLLSVIPMRPSTVTSAARRSVLYIARKASRSRSFTFDTSTSITEKIIHVRFLILHKISYFASFRVPSRQPRKNSLTFLCGFPLTLRYLFYFKMPSSARQTSGFQEKSI